MAKKKSKTKRGKKPSAQAPTKEALSPLPTLPTFDDVPAFNIETASRKRTLDEVSPSSPSAPAGEEENPAKRHCTDSPAKQNDDEGWQHVTYKKGGKSNRGDSYPQFTISPQRIHTWTRIMDLQSLVLHILADAAPPPQWMLIKHKAAIRRVVCLFVPGLSMDLFDGRTNLSSDPDAPKPPYTTLGEYFPVAFEHKDISPALEPLSEMFTHILPVRAGGDQMKLFSPIHNMLNIPVEAAAKKTPHPHQNRKTSKKRLTISELLLTPDDLIENEYPLHSSHPAKTSEASSSDDDDWFETSLKDTPPRNVESSSVLEGYTIYAMDCEMVRTEAGPTLARISLVDWDGNVVLDSLVKPTVPVLDYLTQFSGMTEELLKDVTTTHVDIRQKLAELVDGNTILVGQSLNSDFNALRMRHPLVVDTSVIYEHSRGKPMKPSLKWLANKYLKKEIQKGGERGHDSIEDARACLELVKLKLERGKEFGTNGENFESLFTKLSKANPEKKGAMVDYGDVERRFGNVAAVVKGVSGEEQVVDAVLKAVEGDILEGTPPVEFVWAQLRELNEKRGWCNSYQKFITKMNASLITKDSPAIEIPEIPKSVEGDELREVVERTVARIKRVYDGLPKCSALIVYGGTGSPVEMGRLNAMQTVYRKEFKVKKWDECSVKWTDEEEQALKKAVGEARKGIAFLTVK